LTYTAVAAVCDADAGEPGLVLSQQFFQNLAHGLRFVVPFLVAEGRVHGDLCPVPFYYTHVRYIQFAAKWISQEGLDGGLAQSNQWPGISRYSLARITPSYPKRQTMNEYQVTFANGEVVEVEAWTPEIARVIAEEEADLDGQSTGVELLALQPTEG
jgi:hypothetical protein